MQALGLLGSAFASILNPASILLMIAGVAIGIIFGSIPGLSASMAVALIPGYEHPGSSLYWWYFRWSDLRNPAEYAWYRIFHRNLLRWTPDGKKR